MNTEEEWFNSNVIITNLQNNNGEYKKCREFFEEYKSQGGTIKKYDNFYRKFKKVIEAARKKGIKIIGDESGYKIASDEEEVQQWITRKKKELHTRLETLAGVTGKQPNTIVREMFKKEIKPQQTNQLRFL